MQTCTYLIALSTCISIRRLRSSRDVSPESNQILTFFSGETTLDCQYQHFPLPKEYRNHTADSRFTHSSLISEYFSSSFPRKRLHHAWTRPSRASPLASIALRIAILEDFVHPITGTITDISTSVIKMATSNKSFFIYTKSTTNCGGRNR